MTADNRIQRVSITPTVARQTPKNDFGSELQVVLNEALNRGGAVIGGFLPGVPALSAAVSGTRSVLSQVGGSSPYPAAAYATSSGGVGTGAPTPGPQMGLVNDALAQSQAFSINYLALQHAIQVESRDFNLATNIMKVRHDSAKTAINNIR